MAAALAIPHIRWGACKPSARRALPEHDKPSVSLHLRHARQRPAACHAPPSDTKPLHRSPSAGLPCTRLPPTPPPSAPPKGTASAHPARDKPQALPPPLNARGSPSFAWREATVQPSWHYLHGCRADPNPPSHTKPTLVQHHQHPSRPHRVPCRHVCVCCACFTYASLGLQVLTTRDSVIVCDVLIKQQIQCDPWIERYETAILTIIIHHSAWKKYSDSRYSRDYRNNSRQKR